MIISEVITKLQTMPEMREKAFQEFWGRNEYGSLIDGHKAGDIVEMITGDNTVNGVHILRRNMNLIWHDLAIGYARWNDIEIEDDEQSVINLDVMRSLEKLR